MKYIILLLVFASFGYVAAGQQSTLFPFSSGRWENPFEKSSVSWVKYCYRVLGLGDDQNKPLSNIISDGDSNQTLTSILIKLLKTRKTTGYLSANDSTLLSNEDAMRLLINADSFGISGYQLLESWAYNRSKGKLIARILGIAPCIKNDTTFQPVVWFKYFPLSTEFSACNIPVAYLTLKDKIKEMSLDDFFGNRMFSGRVLKIVPADPSDKVSN